MKSPEKILAILVAAYLILISPLAGAQSKTINPGGGTSPTYSNGVEVTIGDQSQIQFVANRPGGSGLLYLSEDKPPALVLNQLRLRLTGPSGTRIYGNLGLETLLSSFTAVSQSAVTGNGTAATPWQVVTAFRPGVAADSGVLVTVTDSYVFPNLGFTRHVDVTGLSPADTAKLYWTLDSQIYDTTANPGYAVAGSTVGAQDLTTQEKIEIRYNAGQGAVWSHYYSGDSLTGYNQLRSASGDLSDSADASPSRSNTIMAQWNVPAGSTSYSFGADFYYGPAGISAGEAFSPPTIVVGNNSRMTITLTATNAANSAAAFQYTLPAGVSVAAVPNVATTCTPGGGTVTASGSLISVSGMVIQSTPSPTTPYVCTIQVDVVGTAAGTYTPVFASADNSTAYIFRPGGNLDVEPSVVVSSSFVPAVIPANKVSKLIFTVSNIDTLAARTGQDFLYQASDPNLVPVLPQHVTSTCSLMPTVAVTGTQFSISQVNLPAAPSSSTPAQCQITIDVTSAQAGFYMAGFVSSTTGVAQDPDVSSSPLQVVAPSVSAAFMPPIVSIGMPSRFSVTLTNPLPSPFSNGNFSYTFDPALLVAATPNLSSSCPAGAGIVASGNTLTVTGISLNAATAVPYSCTIAFDVASATGGFYVATFDSPDASLTNSSFVFLQVLDSPPGGPLASMSFAQPVISTNQPDVFTITITSFESSPFSALGFDVQFPEGVIPAGSPVPTSTCPAGTAVSLTSPGAHVSNLNLPVASLAAPYSCIISFPITSATSGVYSGFGFDNLVGAWSDASPLFDSLTVVGGLAPPPSPAVSVPVPVTNIWGLLLLMLGLAAVAYRQRY